MMEKKKYLYCIDLEEKIMLCSVECKEAKSGSLTTNLCSCDKQQNRKNELSLQYRLL